MEDMKLVKCLIPTLKRREILLLFLCVVINGLICTRSNIEPDIFRLSSISIGE